MRKVKLLLMVLVVASTLVGCSAVEDLGKDIKSNTSGLERVCTIYYPDGTIETIEGEIRIGEGDNPIGSILHDGKRISLYHVQFICKEK